MRPDLLSHEIGRPGGSGIARDMNGTIDAKSRAELQRLLPQNMNYNRGVRIFGVL
jgi:hypothetical protein